MTVIMRGRGRGRGRRRFRLAKRTAGAAIVILGVLFTSACGLTVPTDPDGTLDSVQGTTMQVGVSPDEGLVDVHGPEPSGPLVELAEEFATSLDTRIDWTVGSEETLVGELEAGNLDLAIGGFTDQTPWTDRVGVTRGYKNIDGADGRSVIFLVPLGENAFLSELEAFLDEEVGS